MVSDVWHCGPVFRAHTSFWFYMMGYFDNSSRIFIVFASSSTTHAFWRLKSAMATTTPCVGRPYWSTVTKDQYKFIGLGNPPYYESCQVTMACSVCVACIISHLYFSGWQIYCTSLICGDRRNFSNHHRLSKARPSIVQWISNDIEDRAVTGRDAIVVLTLQPILKLQLSWIVKYLEISIPIILQIVWIVPSILSIVHIGQDHQLTLTIAAIFDHRIKLISE